MSRNVRAIAVATVLNLLGLVPFAAGALAATCSAPEIVADIPYFSSSMQLASRGTTTIAFVHREDPRISASFKTTVIPPPDTTLSRNTFAREQDAQLFNSKQEAAGRGATVASSVNPFDPIQWRLYYRNDPTFGVDRLVGQYGIYVSSTCLLTATISAPEGDASKGDSYKRRWNALVTAMDEVRENAGKMGDPIRFAQEDLAPKGRGAYAIGMGFPLLASALLYVILNLGVAFGQPSLISRGASGIASISSVVALTGNLLGWAGAQLPVEMLVMLGFCGALTAAGCIMAIRAVTLAATCISAGCGMALLGYGFYGWTGGAEMPYAVGGVLLLCAIVSGLMWGYSRTELSDAV